MIGIDELRTLLRLTRASLSRLALAALLGALTVSFGVGLLATAGYLISRAAQRPAVLSLMVAIVAVRFFGLGRPALRYLERLRSHDFALRVLGRVRIRFYQRIEPLAPAQLDCYRKGDLLARMVGDVDALQNLYLRGIGPPLVALLAGALSVGVAFAFLPTAGLVLATGLLVGALVVPGLTGALGARAGRRQARARGELSAELVELLGGAAETVAFAGEGMAVGRVSAADGRLVKLARRDALVAGMGDGLGLFVTGLTVCAVLAVSITASGDGGLDRVLIAMLALLALATFDAVTPLAGAARELSATLAAGRRILEPIRQEPAVRDPVAPAAAPRWPFSVALEDVRARYPRGHRPALDGINLRLEPGEHVALVGPSGAGKTTIVNLLLRFLDPEAGRMTMAGRDLREYAARDVRRAIAVAGQDSHLFTASISDNVRLSRPDATDWDVEQVLRGARIWGWVEGLPERMDTLVGQQGCELSGGQRQRIVLARALLARAPVLVLDEPTAHLDPSTASELVRDVFAAAGDRTVLLITHRGEGLELVDRVFRLERGAGELAARPRPAAVEATAT
ncbi:MAG: thiol reductant ABC exporter subunit CydC [Solirubrobacterales bacterium]|nr:thiol reductant ABC exporter subunit CydC [Solirubrobacterales bacterium]